MVNIATSRTFGIIVITISLLLLNNGVNTFTIPSQFQQQQTRKHEPSFSSSSLLQSMGRRITSSSLLRDTSTGVINGDTTTATSSSSSKYYTIESKPSNIRTDELIHTLTVRLPTTSSNDDDGESSNDNFQTIQIETGKVARQASGSVTLTSDDTVLLATASYDSNPKDEIDFLPLSVEHQERFSSVGTTSGSYNKRDGRPAEHEILVCRLIDRPIRPLIKEGWKHETQLLSWVLSYDNVRSSDSMAIISSSTALYLSDVPLEKPVAAVMVGLIDGQFVLNPTNEKMDNESKLHLTIAGTKDGVLMIEGFADFLTEEQMIDAVEFGHNAIRILCDAIEEFGNVVGTNKRYDTISTPPQDLQERINDLYTDKVDEMFDQPLGVKKEIASDAMSKLSKEVVEALEEEYPEEKIAIKKAFKNLLSKRLYHKAKTTSTRCDGRDLNQVRPINIETSLLPRVHGSALFTRGETQTIATTTLGGSQMKQKIEKISGDANKRFYLQYTFPPSCVGETGRVGAPGRREVGHGNLAERALIPTLPTEEDFPYTIRVESLITESHGSSSMASVCGGSLALMDAGVPIKSPIAGIAMGLLLEETHSKSDDDNAVVISDISGTEDALGTMDFKVAGNRDGITTFQLDIKCEGLTLSTMTKALNQAREGRLHILDEMDKVLSSHKDELPTTVPKIKTFAIPYPKIGKVIGPGGKQIRAIIEDFELTNMDVDDDGNIQLTAMNTTKINEAEKFVMDLINEDGNGGGGRGGGGKPRIGDYAGPDAVVGEIYNGKITGIHPFGVFVEIIPGPEDGSTRGLEGLCHVSELHPTERIRSCEGFIKSLNTETLEVMYMGITDKGKRRVSRKHAIEEKLNPGSTSKNNNANKRNNDSNNKSASSSEMSKDEMDVIAKAIEGINDNE